MSEQRMNGLAMRLLQWWSRQSRTRGEVIRPRQSMPCKCEACAPLLRIKHEVTRRPEER